MATKSALEIVVELKMMASIPGNRAQMESSSTPILVMFLDHPSSDVVFNGEQALFLLFSFFFFFQKFEKRFFFSLFFKKKKIQMFVVDAACGSSKVVPC